MLLEEDEQRTDYLEKRDSLLTEEKQKAIDQPEERKRERRKEEKERKRETEKEREVHGVGIKGSVYIFVLHCK